MKYFISILLFSIVFTGYAQNSNQRNPETDDYYSKAQQYYLAAKNDSALICLNEGIEVADTADCHKMTKMYILRSTVAGNLTKFEQSMEDALKALSISEQHNLIDSKAAALLCIGKIHYMMYNDEKAEEFMLKAKAIAEEHALQTETMLISASLGELYKVLERNDEALPLLTLALEMAQSKPDTLCMISYLHHLGDYYINLNRWTDPIVRPYQQTAKSYLDEAMSLAQLKNIPTHINNISISMIRWCRVDKNYAKALEYAQGILNNTDPNNYALLIQVYDHLVGIYAYLGDAKRAIESHRQFHSIMIKQSDQNLHRALQEMEVKYLTSEKELEIVRQQTEIERHQAQRIFLITGLSVTVLILFLLWMLLRLRSRRNRVLAETNATKDKFFSIISHDLKNPAIAQRDALQQLITYSGKWDADSLTQYYEELLKSADGQVELLYNLLNWAQVQTGRMPYNPMPFDLASELRSDMALIKNMADRKGILLDVRMSDTAIVTGDRNMLTTVVRNLLTNAVKFTGKGGCVTLDIQPDESSGYTISVADTGTGMNSEQVETLFHIDRQHSQTGTAGEPGSGLGLIVCKELIEKHGSVLRVESKEGKGSRFRFTL